MMLLGRLSSFGKVSFWLQNARLTYCRRFYYRPFLYFVTLASFIAMLRGRRHAWNKLDRTASIRTLPARAPIPAPSLAGIADNPIPV
ncbi:MAG: hypothetical protein ACHRHE_16745 [Tepidisphaerales bacterium]